MGFPICLDKCPICAINGGCLAGNGDDDYVPAGKDQVIKQLDEGRYNTYRDMMIKYLKDKYNYGYLCGNESEEESTKTESSSSCELIRYATEADSKEHMYKDLNDLKEYGNNQASSTIRMALVAVNEDYSKAVLLSDTHVPPPESYSNTDAMINKYGESINLLEKEAEGLLYNTFKLNSRNPDMLREIHVALRESGLEGDQLQAAKDAMYKYIKSKYIKRIPLKRKFYGRRGEIYEIDE